MKTVYDEEKTAEACIYLIELLGGSANKQLVMELLYLTERKALISFGYMITGDIFIMKKGKIRLYELDKTLEEGGMERLPWRKYVKLNIRGELVVKRTLEQFPWYLSPMIADLLREVHGQWRECGGTEGLLEACGELKVKKRVARIITPEEILRAGGVAEAMIKAISEEQEAEWRIELLLRNDSPDVAIRKKERASLGQKLSPPCFCC